MSSPATVTRQIFDGYEAQVYTAAEMEAATELRPIFWRQIFPITVFGTYSVVNLKKGNKFILDSQVAFILENAAGTTIGAFAPNQLIEVTAISDDGDFVCERLSNTLPAVKFTTSSAASGVTPTGAAWSGAALVVWQNTTDGAMAVTTPTAANITDALVAAGFPSDTPYVLRIANRGDNTITLTAGSNVTITGETTIATLVTRDYAVTMNSLLGTVEMTSISKGTIET